MRKVVIALSVNCFWILFVGTPVNVALAQAISSLTQVADTGEDRKMELLRAYQINTTTEEQFFSDGWNLKDLARGKIAIARMSGKKGKVLKITLSKAQPVTDTFRLDFIDMTAESIMENYRAGGEVSADLMRGPGLCSLSFIEGILKEYNCTKF